MTTLTRPTGTRSRCTRGSSTARTPSERIDSSERIESAPTSPPLPRSPPPPRSPPRSPMGFEPAAASAAGE